jgi:ketosteroid isomerase-like protein
MSQANVEIVRRALAARNSGDVDVLLALMTEDIVIDASRRIIDPVTATGHDGARRFAAMLDEVWADQRQEADEWIDAGDAVVVPMRLINIGRASGVPVEARSAWVVYIRDGRISRLVVYQSRAEALEAVGLPEQDAQADN